MNRRVAVLLLTLLVAAPPAEASRRTGSPDRAAALVMALDEGTEVLVSCPTPPPDVDAYFTAAVVTNTAGGKIGRNNAAMMAAYNTNQDDAYVYVHTGGYTAGTEGPSPARGERTDAGFTTTLQAAYPSLLRIAQASWGAPYGCSFTVGERALVPVPVERETAWSARATDLDGVGGFDSTVATASVEQHATVEARGFFFALTTCSTGATEADGPEGQRYALTPASFVRLMVIVEPSRGTWTFTRSCADGFSPVLWTMTLPPGTL